MNAAGVFSPSQFRNNPYRYYAQLRKEAAVHFFEAGFHTLSRYHDIVEALKRPDRFSSHNISWQSTPAGEDPPVHTRLRRIASRLISKHPLPKLEALMRETTDSVLAKIQSNNEFDLMTTLATELPFTIIWEILSIPENMRIACFDWLRQLKPSPLVEDQLASSAIWEGEGESLTKEQRIRFARFLLIAATDTTRNLIGNAILALLEHPDQMNLVREDKMLISGVVEETLRYDTPIPILDRRAATDLEIGKVRIPKGSEILLLVASANRDPEVFSEPDRFLVTRDASKHIGFGEGPHYCLGAQLGRLETRIALEGLLFRLPPFQAVYPLDQVKHLDSIKLRGLSSLRLKFKR